MVFYESILSPLLVYINIMDELCPSQIHAEAPTPSVVFSPSCAAGGILVPQPGIELGPGR